MRRLVIILIAPIVMSYSEALKLNVDALNETDIQFLNPFVPYHLKDKLKERLYVELVGITLSLWVRTSSNERRNC